MDSQHYAAPVHENTGFCGQTVSKSTSVHEIVDSGGQDAKQPGFYVELIYPFRQLRHHFIKQARRSGGNFSME